MISPTSLFSFFPFIHIPSLPAEARPLPASAPGKLRWCNRSRLLNRLISWSNRLLINFFNPNSSSESESSWQNRLKHVQIISKRSKTIDSNLKEIESDPFYWKSQIISTYLINLDIFDLSIDNFDLLINHFWSIFD